MLDMGGVLGDVIVLRGICAGYIGSVKFGRTHKRKYKAHISLRNLRLSPLFFMRSDADPDSAFSCRRPSSLRQVLSEGGCTCFGQDACLPEHPSRQFFQHTVLILVQRLLFIRGVLSIGQSTEARRGTERVLVALWTRTSARYCSAHSAPKTTLFTFMQTELTNNMCFLDFV